MVFAAAFRRITEDTKNPNADSTEVLNSGQTFDSNRTLTPTATTTAITWTPGLPPGSAPVFDALVGPILNQIANLIPRAIAAVAHAITAEITTAVQNVSNFLTSIAQGVSYVRANAEVIWRNLSGPLMPWTVFRGVDGYYYVGMGM